MAQMFLYIDKAYIKDNNQQRVQQIGRKDCELVSGQEQLVMLGKET
jgi:hypothetical protein